jgi:hypothetical protein
MGTQQSQDQSVADEKEFQAFGGASSRSKERPKATFQIQVVIPEQLNRLIQVTVLDENFTVRDVKTVLHRKAQVHPNDSLLYPGGMDYLAPGMRAVVKYRKPLVYDFWGNETKFKYVIPPELPGTVKKRMTNWGVSGGVAYALTFDDSTYLNYEVSDPCPAEDIAETFPLDDSRTLSYYGFKPGQPIIMRFTKSFVPTCKPRAPERIVSPWMFFDPLAKPGAEDTQLDEETDVSNIPVHQRQAYMEKAQKRLKDRKARANDPEWQAAQAQMKRHADDAAARFKMKCKSYWENKEAWARKAKREEMAMSCKHTKGHKRIEDVLCQKDAAECGVAAAQALLHRGHSRDDWPALAAAAGAAAGAAVGLATKASPIAGTPEECNTAAALAAARAAVDTEADRQLSKGHPKFKGGKRDIQYIGEVAGKAAKWAGGSSEDVGKAVAEAVLECDGSKTDTVLAVGMQVGIFVAEQEEQKAQEAKGAQEISLPKEAARAAVRAARETGGTFAQTGYLTLNRDTIRVAVNVGTYLCKGAWQVVGNCLSIGVEECMPDLSDADEDTMSIFFEEARDELLQVVVLAMIMNGDPPEQAATSASDALEAAGRCRPHWDEVTRLSGLAAAHVRLHETALKRGITKAASDKGANELAEEDEDYEEWSEEVMLVASLAAPLHILEFSAQEPLPAELVSGVVRRRSFKGAPKANADGKEKVLPGFEAGDFLRDERNSALYQVFHRAETRGGKTLQLIARCEITKQNQKPVEDDDFFTKPHLLFAYTGKTTGGRYEERKRTKDGQFLAPAKLANIDRNEDMEDTVLKEVQAQAAAIVVIGLLQKPKQQPKAQMEDAEESHSENRGGTQTKKRGKRGSLKQSTKAKKKGGGTDSDADASEEGGRSMKRSPSKRDSKRASKRGSKRGSTAGLQPPTPTAKGEGGGIFDIEQLNPTRRQRRVIEPPVLDVEEPVLKLAKAEAKDVGGGKQAVEYVVYDLLLRTFEVHQADPGRATLNLPPH